MPNFFKIFILIIMLSCLPFDSALGYFATPDNTVHSMNFGIQKNAKTIPSSPPAGTYINTQNNATQNVLPVNPANPNNSQPTKNNQPLTNKKFNSSVFWLWSMWIIIISCLIALFVFLLKKL